MLDFIIQGLLELFPKSVQWLITAVLVAFLLAILRYAWSQGLLG